MNSTNNATVQPSTNPDQPYNQIVTILNVTVSTLGILANSLVLISASLKIIKTTSFILLLLNLSLADIVMNVCMLLHLFIEERHFHASNVVVAAVICVVVAETDPLYIAVFVNTVTMTYISFLRSHTFSTANKYKRNALKKKRVIWGIAILWFLGILCLLPNYFIFEIDANNGCVTTKREFYNIYGAVVGILVCKIPLAVLILNSLRTMLSMWKNSYIDQSVVFHHRKNISVLVISLLVSYICLATPNAIKLCLKAAGQLPEDQHSVTNDVFLLVTTFTSIVDPVIYMFCWSGFRNGFRENLKTLRKEKKVHRISCKSTDTAITNISCISINSV